MDETRLSASELFRKYDAERKKLAVLPFEEKIRIVIEMQKRAAALRPDLNRTVWDPAESVPEIQTKRKGFDGAHTGSGR